MKSNIPSLKAAPKVLIVANVWPEPDSSAAGKHMMQLLETLSVLSEEMLFTCTAVESHFVSPRLSEICKTANIRMNCSSFDQLVSDFSPDLVVYDRFLAEEQFGWRVRERCPEAVTMLNTEDLHFVRRWRENNRSDTGFSCTDIPVSAFLTTDAQRELAALFRSDLTLLISEAEHRLLLHHLPATAGLLQYHPLCKEGGNQALNTVTDHQTNVISLGNFLHKPNQDAALTLIQHLWPALGPQLKNAELHLYGAYPSEKHFRWSQPAKRVWVKGRAKNLQETLCAHRLMLAPIRFGSGIKGKLLDAMQFGLPFVTTPIGIEGIDSTENCEPFVGFTREDFIQKSVRLYEDVALRNEFRAWAHEVLNNRFESRAHETSLIKTLTARLRNRSHFRQQNIIGAMLQHHSLASTRYMGKWIEAKNAGIT
ncbi:Glycosyltransferase involved in cell wall bisynthesis [Cyclonatronum proteinivorum]|uniref:Glycosyltransferase involved in cell wall bisynthesis n=1 Tax=Cyclonatronum proteinivorum TaxID=1457365 RepID=A0A345UN94_9BACT|nr:glycosyltransferase family 4 protein [Cyclonatronum proteinivorum]AXJ01946.1 Glycosyltransferase involved in cell wall bisynthesis [Cyclonatronum proteinivorum]